METGISSTTIITINRLLDSMFAKEIISNVLGAPTFEVTSILSALDNLANRWLVHKQSDHVTARV